MDIPLLKFDSPEEDDLEPPFEIHGMTNTGNQGQLHVVEIESDDDEGEEVPPSILFEAHDTPEQSPIGLPPRQYDLSNSTRRVQHRRRSAVKINHQISSWVDVGNLDEFLTRIYNYFRGKGMFCILLESLMSLLTVLFVVGLLVFVTECIDFSLLKGNADAKTLSDIIVPQCYLKMGWIPTLAVVWVIFWWLYQIFKLVYMIPELWEVKLFYANVLEIQDSELQTLLWNTVVTKIINSYKSEMEENGLQGLDMDAHVVANMIMRKENYLIALFNKEILDLRVPYLGQKQWMTRQMQAYISYGVFSYVFDLKGRVGKRFLKKAYRAQLVDGLRKRFQTMGLLSLLFSPFLFIFMIVRYFLTITEEYRQNPALLTSRSYSPLALWKFREFNELPHLFDKRLSRSYESAAKYMQQFPNYYMIILARFISFVSGSFATVLLVITLYEDEFQQGFEITPGRSAFFFVGIFGTIFAATNGYTKENLILEPQKQMNEIVLDTHYHPPAWRSKAHLPEVRDEFSNLFELKVVLLAQELFSVLLAPIILYYGLPRCSEQIIDFFSECTVVSPKLGHVCSFAKFDLQKHGNAEFGVQTDNPDRNVTRDGKLESSFMNFKATYPEWDPGVQGSQYITKMIQRKHGISLKPAAGRFQEMDTQYLQNDGSIMEYSAEHGYEVGRELIKLLDAVYDENK